MFVYLSELDDGWHLCVESPEHSAYFTILLHNQDLDSINYCNTVARAFGAGPVEIPEEFMREVREVQKFMDIDDERPIADAVNKALENIEPL